MGQDVGRRSKGDPEAGSTRDDQAADSYRAFNVLVGEAIRRSRYEHGWTQVSLASRAGLSPNYVARLERGELGPSLFVAQRLCSALSIAIDALVAPGPPGAAEPKRAAADGGTADGKKKRLVVD